jgi:hypothetical protein
VVSLTRTRAAWPANSLTSRRVKAAATSIPLTPKSSVQASTAAAPGCIQSRRLGGRGRRSRNARQASVSGVAIEDAIAAAISHQGVMGVQFDPGFSTCICHKARAPDIPTPSAAMKISMSPMPNRRVLRSIDVPPALSPFETNSADFGR